MIPTLGKVQHLSNILDVHLDELNDVANHMNDHCKTLKLTNPCISGFKERIVRSMDSKLRTIQDRIYERLLLPHLVPSVYSFGCVKGQSIRTNAEVHKYSDFAYTCDIANFYPSIHNSRVNNLCLEKFHWDPDVARLFTKLCTCDHHLALGLTTSPILANELLYAVDRRIGGMCDKMGLKYSRYVDDITISGFFEFDPKKSGVPKLIVSILRDHGFKTKPSKDEHGLLIDGVAITQIRVRNGKFDVKKEFIKKLERRIQDAKSLSQGGHFDGPYFTKDQIKGQINYTCWINPGRRRTLFKLYNSINWSSVQAEAIRRGLIVAKKKLIPVYTKPNKKKLSGTFS